QELRTIAAGLRHAHATRNRFAEPRDRESPPEIQPATARTSFSDFSRNPGAPFALLEFFGDA
ncbi:MAG: hypothetical protein ACKOHG_06475, partial [Planctomycetia bacterium]